MQSDSGEEFRNELERAGIYRGAPFPKITGAESALGGKRNGLRDFPARVER